MFASLIALAGTAFLLWTQEPDPQWAAVRNLPAYHQLRRSDLVAVGGVASDAGSLLGRYTLTPLSVQQRVDVSMLGPRLPAGYLATTRLAGFTVSPAATLEGQLGRGDVVDVLVGGQRVRWLCTVRIVDVRKDGERHAIVVALAATDATALASAGDADVKALLRRTVYVDPLESAWPQRSAPSARDRLAPVAGCS